MEKPSTAPYEVWFTADLHLRHTQILHYQKNRIMRMRLADEFDIKAHDNYIVEMWKRTIKPGDYVYLLGDVVKAPKEKARVILNDLKSTGCKIHLIAGNHDENIRNLTELFESIDDIKIADFRCRAFPYLEHDLKVVMCHYPLVSWPFKHNGSLMLFGHIHNNSPWINEGTEGELRLNVGLDAPMADYGLINLRTIYAWWKAQIGQMSPADYIDAATAANPRFVR